MTLRRTTRCAAAVFVVGFLGIAAACTTKSGGTGGGTSTGSNMCSEQPCSLVSQCGCAGNQECTIDSKGAHYCALVGTAHPGEDCSTHGCVAGSACVSMTSGATMVATCAAFCEGDSDCANGTICSRHISDGMGGVLPVTLCSDACDPAANTGCTAPGTGCIFARESMGNMRWYAQCAPPKGTAMLGADCSTNPCAAGLVCGQGTTGSVCYQYCTLDGTHGCPGTTKCIAFPTPIKIGMIEYGACQ
jgi:hypothetical protein